MEENRIVEYVLACKRESEEAYLDRRAKADEGWQVYRGIQDFSKKADWQSKCFIPKMATAIDKAVALVKRALIGTKAFFTVESESHPEKCEAVKKLVDFWLTRSDFKTKFVQALFPGMITGWAVQKYYWSIEKKLERQLITETEVDEFGTPITTQKWDKVERLVSGLKIKNVSNYNFYIDPTAKELNFADSRYTIERVEMDLAELKQMVADEKDLPEDDRVWDAKAIDGIEADFASKSEDLDERTRNGMLPSKNPYRRKVELLEFWGDIIDDDTNKIVHRGCVCTIANSKYVIRKPEPNPFWHGKPPYVLIIPKPDSNRVEGKSLIEDDVRMNYTMNNIVNLQVDNLSYAILKMFRVDEFTGDQNDLYDLYPGKVFRGPANSIEEIKMGDIPMGSFAELNFFDREIQQNTSITDPVMGMSSNKGRQTLGEVNAKTSNSMSHFDSIAFDLEDISITNIVEMTYSLIFQFMDWSEPYVAKILGSLVIPLDISRLSEDERRDLISGNFVFKGGGISLMVAKEEKISKLFKLLELAINPMMQGKYDPGKIADKVIELLGVGNVAEFQGQGMPMIPGQPGGGQGGAIPPQIAALLGGAK